MCGSGFHLVQAFAKLTRYNEFKDVNFIYIAHMKYETNTYTE